MFRMPWVVAVKATKHQSGIANNCWYSPLTCGQHVLSCALREPWFLPATPLFRTLQNNGWYLDSVGLASFVVSFLSTHSTILHVRIHTCLCIHYWNLSNVLSVTRFAIVTIIHLDDETFQIILHHYRQVTAQHADIAKHGPDSRCPWCRRPQLREDHLQVLSQSPNADSISISSIKVRTPKSQEPTESHNSLLRQTPS